jgi:segregation and condensation protein A
LSKEERTTFSKMVAEAKTRIEIAVTFLALLELVKRYRVNVHQEGLFSDIQIEKRGEFAEDEDFELEFE